MHALSMAAGLGIGFTSVILLPKLQTNALLWLLGSSLASLAGVTALRSTLAQSWWKKHIGPLPSLDEKQLVEIISLAASLYAANQLIAESVTKLGNMTVETNAVLPGLWDGSLCVTTIKQPLRSLGPIARRALFNVLDAFIAGKQFDYKISAGEMFVSLNDLGIRFEAPLPKYSQLVIAGLDGLNALLIDKISGEGRYDPSGYALSSKLYLNTLMELQILGLGPNQAVKLLADATAQHIMEQQLGNLICHGVDIAKAGTSWIEGYAFQIALSLLNAPALIMAAPILFNYEGLKQKTKTLSIKNHQTAEEHKHALRHKTRAG